MVSFLTELSLLWGVFTKKNFRCGDLPDSPVAKSVCSQGRGLGSIPGQRTRAHALQLKIPRAAIKTWSSQKKKNSGEINIAQVKHVEVNNSVAFSFLYNIV